MAHSFDGKAYRYAFIFNKGNLTESLNQELQDYIQSYQKIEKELDISEVTTGCGIYAYDDTIFIELEETRVMAVYVVVLFGMDWMNFIEDLFDFHDHFPSDKILRESNMRHILKDEKQLFDDFQ